MTPRTKVYRVLKEELKARLLYLSWRTLGSFQSLKGEDS